MKRLICLLYLFTSIVYCKSDTYLIVGETGVGKSGFVNLKAGKEVAKEGPSFSAETSVATTYTTQKNAISTDYIDTPGLLDPRGLTEEEILKLAQAELLRKEHEGTDNLSGIILMLDGALNRVRVQTTLLSLIKMLGKSCLNSTVIAVNKIEKVPVSQRQELLAYVRSEAKAVGIDPDRVLAIDTKTNPNIYSPALEEKLRGLPVYNLDGMKELETKVDVYFKEELANEKNYINTEKKIPEIIENIIQENFFIDEVYTENCNCYRFCKTNIFGICVDWNTRCGTCHRVRQIPQVRTKVERETIYKTVSHRKLKNEEDYYQRLAKERVIEEMRAFVFQQQEKRQQTNKNETIDL